MAEWPDQGKIKTLHHCHTRICCARLTFGMNKKTHLLRNLCMFKKTVLYISSTFSLKVKMCSQAVSVNLFTANGRAHF